MPVTTVFNSAKHEESVEAILSEFLLDYFPASSYITTFEPPGDPVKTTLWLQLGPSRNREPRVGDGTGKWVQGKRMMFFVSILSRDRSDCRTAADRLTGAMLASSSVLGASGLRYAELTPFQDITVDTQSQQYRRAATLDFTVEIRA